MKFRVLGQSDIPYNIINIPLALSSYEYYNIAHVNIAEY